MNEGQKVAYISIGLSVLPVVVTLATGFISIANTVSILTVKVGEMREDLRLSHAAIQKDLLVRDGRLDRIESRLDILSNKK